MIKGQQIADWREGQSESVISFGKGQFPCERLLVVGKGIYRSRKVVPAFISVGDERKKTLVKCSISP